MEPSQQGGESVALFPVFWSSGFSRSVLLYKENRKLLCLFGSDERMGNNVGREW